MDTRAWAGATAFVLAAGLVGGMLRYTRWRGVVDVPNHRSSHTFPTPRGGGVGLVAAAIIAAVAWLPQESRGATVAVAGLMTLVLCVVGWYDDRGGLSVRVRFGIHLLSAGAVAALASDARTLPWLPLGPVMALWLGWTVSSINIINFMDGIDGLVASQVALFALGAALVAPSGSAAGIAAVILAGASCGFLLWNWAPARIFLGDAGSGPLGLLAVIVGALAAQVRAEGPFVFLPLFFLFLDSLLTMVRRKRRGERLTEPHRSHLYQRLTRTGWSHARVSALYALVAAPGVALVVMQPRLPIAVTGVTAMLYAGACALLWHLLDGRAPARA